MKRLSISVFAALLGIASTCIVADVALDLGAPRRLALGSGLLVFPILPAMWHLVAELRRRNRGDEATSLTGFGRLIVRVGIVEIVIAVGVVAVGPHRVWRAVRDRWPIADHASRLGVATLLSSVPPAAEALLWLRGPRLRELAPTLVDDDDLGALDAVAAWDSAHGMIATRGKGFDPVLGLCEAIGCPGRDGLVPVVADARVWSSFAWKTGPGGGPSPALARLLDRVPSDAVVAIVGQPQRLATSVRHDRSPDDATFQALWNAGVFFGGALAPEDARTIVVWARLDGEEVTARVELEAVDDDAAHRLDAGLHEFADGWARKDGCRHRASMAASASVHRDNTSVAAVVHVRLEEVRALTICVFGRTAD
jgi:hypothetical protein